MWLKVLAIAVIGTYLLALTLVLLFSLVQFLLFLKYQKARKRRTAILPSLDSSGDVPMVTIQLPVYNERFVAARLIDNIIKLEYPIEKLDIQVLDDSTDETRELIAEKVFEYQAQGYPIRHIHRVDRKGYKAGALKDGMKEAEGEFIVIFDADFLPEPDFLLKTLPYFSDPTVGVVQSRWSHLNEEESWLTQLQAFQLNVHFTIEQTGRHMGNYFLQFNGTAGVWRKIAIDDAGGWEADTLTEDLDLSYRAQMKGWKIVYQQDIASPAELPSEIHSLKSQQFRWMKGGAENARKLIPTILQAKIPFTVKLLGIAHLLSSSVFLLGLVLAILSLPVLLLMNRVSMDSDWLATALVGIGVAAIVFYVANRDTSWKSWSETKSLANFLYRFPMFLSLSMGMSLHNSIAVIEGFRGKPSPFVRTPKFSNQALGGKLEDFYVDRKITGTTLLEGLLSLYFLACVLIGLFTGKTGFLVYHMMLLIGFGMVFFASIAKRSRTNLPINLVEEEMVASVNPKQRATVLAD